MYGKVAWFRISIPLLLLIPVSTFSQSVTLDSMQNLARKNYPAIKQKDLLKKTATLNVNNLNKNFLPQLSVNGQATYQSDVTSIDVTLPGGVKIEAPSKDQYKFTADVNQLIYDGGVTKQQKTLAEMNAVVEDQQVEVELYRVKEKVNDIFLGILYTDELIKQTELVEKDLQTGLKKVDAQVQNGVAYRSSANILKAEILKIGQRRIELQSSRKSLIETLALFTGEKMDDQLVFERPSVASSPNEISRPELKLYNDQFALLGRQNKLINARNMPRTSLFVQGGYGRPALNFLKNDFEPFYVTGVKLGWALNGFYTRKNDRQLVKINQDIVDSKKETFLLNTNAQLTSQRNEIEKLNKLIQSDNEIIELRRSVTEAAKAQLENGVMTASDYLVEVNAEDQSRQVLIAHELQLLQAQIVYNTIKGN